MLSIGTAFALGLVLGAGVVLLFFSLVLRMAQARLDRAVVLLEESERTAKRAVALAARQDALGQRNLWVEMQRH